MAEDNNNETPAEKKKRLATAAAKKAGILKRIGEAVKKWTVGTGTRGGFKGVRDLTISQKKKLKIMEEIDK